MIDQKDIRWVLSEFNPELSVTSARVTKERGARSGFLIPSRLGSEPDGSQLAGTTLPTER